MLENVLCVHPAANELSAFSLHGSQHCFSTPIHKRQLGKIHDAIFPLARIPFVLPILFQQGDPWAAEAALQHPLLLCGRIENGNS
jgi:hypothetical protein